MLLVDVGRSGWCAYCVGAGAGLAGRTGELRAACELLAGESDAAVMLVVGEAGVGKSRLVGAAAAEVAGSDVLVVSGWCLRLSEGMPFLPVLDVLQALLEVDEGQLVKSALAECPPFVTNELVCLVPDLEQAERPGPSDSGDGWGRQRLFDALRRLLAALAQLRRVAVIIEDVHWADPSTFEFLEYLMAPGHATGVPMLLTCRGHDALTEPLAGWLERVQRSPGMVWRDLAPLNEEETAEQIEMVLGRKPPNSLVASIFRRSEGNPFFTEQLAAARKNDDDAGMPTRLRSLLLSRAAGVDGIAREVLDVLAIASRPLDEASILRISQRPEGEVRKALRELLALRLLRQPDRVGRHSLRHVLLAEALSAELLPSEKRELNARVADLIAEWEDPSLAAQVAEHYGAAGRAPEELHWRVVAGWHAEAVYASNEAAQHWRRAAALWDTVHDPAAAAGVGLAELYEHAWITTENAGDGVAAGALAEEALERLSGTAPPATLLNLYRAVGRFRSIESDAGLAALERAIEVGERVSSSRDFVVVLAEYALELRVRGRYEESESFVARALLAARVVGDVAHEREQAMALAGLAAARGDIEAATRRLNDAVQIRVDSDRDPATALSTAVLHTDLLLQLGLLDDVTDVGQAAVDLARRSGLSAAHRTIVVCGNMYEALVERGELSRAAFLVDSIITDAPSRDSRNLHAARADLDMRRGRFDDAAAFWHANHAALASVSALETQYAFALQRGELSLWRGDPASAFFEAYSILEDICRTESSGSSGGLFVLALRAGADVAERARAADDAAAIENAVRNAARLSELLTNASIDPFVDRPLPVTSTADWLSWQAEWTRLQHESNAALWGDVAAAWDALGRPHRSAYARWKQAESLLADRHGRSAAVPVLRTAATQARHHVPLTRAITELARRARIDLTQTSATTPPNTPPVIRKFDLTDREHAVLRLLAEGKSNREIGAILFINAKTASVHVSNILRKLNVSTRVQAAAVAERAGLLTADPAHHGR